MNPPDERLKLPAWGDWEPDSAPYRPRGPVARGPVSPPRSEVLKLLGAPVLAAVLGSLLSLVFLSQIASESVP